MVESHLYWGLILECVLFRTRDQVYMCTNDLKVDLNNMWKALARAQESFKTITEECVESQHSEV